MNRVAVGAAHRSRGVESHRGVVEARLGIVTAEADLGARTALRHLDESLVASLFRVFGAVAVTALADGLSRHGGGSGSVRVGEELCRHGVVTVGTGSEGGCTARLLRSPTHTDAQRRWQGEGDQCTKPGAHPIHLS